MTRHGLLPIGAILAIVVLASSAPLQGRSTGWRGGGQDRFGPASVLQESGSSSEQPRASGEPVEDLDALLPPCPPLDASTVSDHQEAAPLDGPVAACDQRELDLGPSPIKKQARTIPGITLTDEPQ
jgi:hypothetical protein